MDKKRIEWIDISKAIGIILVIAGHTITPKYFIIWLYSFHMPLFFFLSGYTLSVKKYNGKSFPIKKIETIALPYFFFAIIFFIRLLIKSFFYNDFNSLLPNFLGIFCAIRNTEYGVGVWFLACLFVSELLLYLTVVLSRNNGKIIAVCVSVSCFLGFSYAKFIKYPLPWGVDASLVALFFMGMGYLFRKYSMLSKRPLNNRSFIIILLALSICFSLINSSRITSVSIDYHVDMYSNQYGNFLFFLIGSFSGIVFVVLLSMRIKSKILGFLGKNTLVIYGLHSHIIYILDNFEERIIDINMSSELIKLFPMFANIILVIVLLYPFILFYNKFIKNLMILNKKPLYN